VIPRCGDEFWVVPRRYGERAELNQKNLTWCREGESNPQDPKVGGF
jgi:hypothetical protein